MFILNNFSTCFGHHYANLQENKPLKREIVKNKPLTFASCWFSLSLHNLLTMHGHRNLNLRHVSVQSHHLQGANYSCLLKLHLLKYPIMVQRCVINRLAPELFFLILAHPVYKMWIIQEPNTLELRNKLHFEEVKNGECTPRLKYSVLIFLE